MGARTVLVPALRCQECGARNFGMDQGMHFCRSCGLMTDAYLYERE